MLSNTILSGTMASGKRTSSSTTTPSPTVTSTITSNSGTKKKLTKSFSSDNNSSSGSNKRCKSKEMTINAKEKKKRHSFSFGFFSDRSSSKQNNNNNNNKDTDNNGNSNNNNSNRSPQHERKKSTTTTGGGATGSSPKNIQRRNSNGNNQNNNTNNSTRSPQLTNKTYRTTNSSFEKAALFGQKEPSFSTDDEDEEDETSRSTTTKSHSQSHMVPPSQMSLPVPTILINGEAWDGKTDISDEEEDDEDGDPDTRRSKKGTSTLDHNLFITSNGLIQRGGSMECMAGGKGLRQGFVDTESTFFIETEEPFDTCSLCVEIKGPKQKPIKITTHLLDENLCSFSYWARRVGYYMIGVKWKGEHVVGSPFDVTILAISKSNHKKQ